MRFLPPHTTAVQTNGLLMYTGTALPNPAAVRVQRCFLSHFLKDLLSLQLCCRQVLLLLRFLLRLTHVPGPLRILALGTCADNMCKHQLDTSRHKRSYHPVSTLAVIPRAVVHHSIHKLFQFPFTGRVKLVNTSFLKFFSLYFH